MLVRRRRQARYHRRPRRGDAGDRRRLGLSRRRWSDRKLGCRSHRALAAGTRGLVAAMSWRSPAQGGLQSLDTMSQLLRGRANRYAWLGRSEEHTSELQSLMRISYAVFGWKKKTKKQHSRNAIHIY